MSKFIFFLIPHKLLSKKQRTDNLMAMWLDYGMFVFFIKYGYKHQVLCCPDIPEACHQLYILMNVVFDLILGEHYGVFYFEVQGYAGMLIIL